MPCHILKRNTSVIAPAVEGLFCTSSGVKKSLRKTGNFVCHTGKRQLQSIKITHFYILHIDLGAHPHKVLEHLYVTFSVTWYSNVSTRHRRKSIKSITSITKLSSLASSCSFQENNWRD